MGRVELHGERQPSLREPHCFAGAWLCLARSPVGTLMRHALPQAEPIRPLAAGVVAPPLRASLVAAPGLAHRLTAPLLGTRIRAVDVAAVAVAADPHLPTAAGTEEEAVAVPDFGLPRRRAGRSRLPGPHWPRVSTNMLLRMCGDPDGGPARQGWASTCFRVPRVLPLSEIPESERTRPHQERGLPTPRAGDSGASAYGSSSAVPRLPTNINLNTARFPRVSIAIYRAGVERVSARGGARREGVRGSAGEAPIALSPEQREQVLALSKDLPRLFRASTTKVSQKKDIVRLLIEDVTLANRDDPWEIEVSIRWKTGVVSRHAAVRPKLHPQTTSEDVVRRVEALYREKTDAEIAAILNAEGHTSGTGRLFTVGSVAHLRRSRGWWKHRRPQRSRG